MIERNERQNRCLRAMEDLLTFVRKDASVGEDVVWLENRFRSVEGILEGCRPELAGGRISDAEAQLLSLIPEITRYALHREHGVHPRLNTFEAASDYLRTLFIGVNVEQFWVLCLNASGRLIECRLLQTGTLDETPFYLGRLLQSVVETDAAAVVLCHNHPGGTRRCSSADVECTLSALRALFSLRVMLLDHVIIAGSCAVSMRAGGEVDAALWVGQNRASGLLKDWLKTFVSEA